jgi:NDP-sugar pyrophosphorylase family protein
MQVVILAGGLATRLGSLAGGSPKSMVEIEGHPFIAYQLSMLKRFGVNKVLLCVGHLGNQIQEFVGDGGQFGLEVSYSDEGKRLLGTAGALKNAESHLENEFALVYGDSYSTIPVASTWDKFLASKSPAMMVVLKNKNKYGRSNCEVKSGFVTKYVKGSKTQSFEYIDFGLVCLRRSVLSSIPSGTPTDLSVLFSALVGKRKLLAHEVFQRFYEVGSVKGIAEFTKYVKIAGSDDLLWSPATGHR